MPTEIICPKCSSKNVIFSKKRNAYVCEDCDHVLSEKTAASLRIFLSYGHDANEELVRRIKTDLEKRGHNVWFDKSEIKFGDDWRHSITNGILKSNRVLSFLSKHSTRDPGVCIDEIGIAIGVKGGNVQTILVEGEAEVQPPPSISHIQWLDMHEWKDKQGVDKATWNTWYNEKFAEIVRVVESDESVRFAGEIEDLMSKLKPVKSDTKMGELLRKPFIGREWMHEAVENWRNKRDDDSRLFWIVGNPGVGKSAFVANLAHFGKARVIALHFCEWNKQSHKDPRQVVLNIAFQLACRLADYRKLLLTLPQIDLLAAKSETELFDYLLVEPLQSVIDGGRERYLVIIDALDEANADGRNAVAELLAQHARRLPEWLGILITSRPEEEVMTPLRGLSGLKPFILETTGKENLDDIRSYLRHALPNASEAEIDAILNKSDGVFLYAEYVCEELRNNRLFLDRLDAFPHGLGGIYAQYFARQFPDLATYKRTTRHVLGVLAAAREPLEPDFLAALFGWDTYQQEDFFDSMGSLLRLSANTIHPFHKSLFDWLADKSKAGNYFVSTGEGQKELADHGMREYRRSVQDLSSYHLRHLPSHLTELERWEGLIGDEKTPGLLTDLHFIQVKCEAGLVHELVSDYNAALAALPEFAEENERNRRRDVAMLAYNRALREYAGARCDWWFAKERGEMRPELPYPPMPEELRDDAQHAIAEESSNRAARLRHFANFASGQLTPLAQSPKDTLPLAYNWSASGPVADQAQLHIHDHSLPWLKRSPRPPAHPLRPQYVRTLQGHGNAVLSVSVSPDGRCAVSGSSDNTLRVWDLENGQCLRIIEGHAASVLSVSVSLDGRCAVSGSSDNTLRVWDLENGQCLRIIEGHADGVLSVSVSPDGRCAVSASEDGTLRVWDVKGGTCLRTLEGHCGRVLSVSVTPDGRRAVSGGTDQTVRVWDLESGVCLWTLEDHDSIVTSLSVSPDGCRAVSGSFDMTVRLWNLETGECLLSLGHSAMVSSVSVTPDGRRAVSVDSDYTVRMWNLESGVCLWTLKGHPSDVKSVSLTPDGRYAVMATGHGDAALRFWNLEVRVPPRTLEGHRDRVSSVSVMPDGLRVVSGSWDRTFRVWNLDCGSCLRTLEAKVLWNSSVSMMPDGRRAVTGSLTDLVLWDLENSASSRILADNADSVSSVSVTPDGRCAVTGGNAVRVWDLKTGACLRTLKGHSDPVWSVNVTPDGRHAVTGSWDKTVRVWGLESGACLRVLEGHTADVISVCITPDGRHAVSGSMDKTVRMWDLKIGECVRTMEGHNDDVNCVSVTPDGWHAVSGSVDKTVCVWNLMNSACFAVYHADANVLCVAISSVGQRIVCGTADGQMHFLTPVNFPPPGPPIITPVRFWLFGSPGKDTTAGRFLRRLIGKARDKNNGSFPIPGRWDDHLTCCCAHCGKRFEAPPVKAGHEPHSEKCPHCNGTLMINPFVVDHKL